MPHTASSLNKKEAELKRLIEKYNVLACPKRGVSKIIPRDARASFIRICDKLGIKSI